MSRRNVIKADKLLTPFYHPVLLFSFRVILRIFIVKTVLLESEAFGAESYVPAAT